MSDQDENQSNLGDIMESLEEVVGDSESKEQKKDEVLGGAVDVIPDNLSAQPAKQPVEDFSDEVFTPEVATESAGSHKALIIFVVLFLFGSLGGMAFLLLKPKPTPVVAPTPTPTPPPIPTVEPTPEPTVQPPVIEEVELPVTTTPPPSPIAGNTIESIELIESTRFQTMVEIKTKQPVTNDKLNSQLLEGDNPRLVIDLDGDWQPMLLKPNFDEDLRISGVRSGLHQNPNRIRLVFDLSRDFNGKFKAGAANNLVRVRLEEPFAKDIKPMAFDEQAAVEGVMKRAKAKFRDCYENALARNSRLQGKLVLGFFVSQFGKARGLKLQAAPSINDKGLARCVSRVLNSLTFPSGIQPTSKFRYPFEFEPKIVDKQGR